MSTTQSHEAMTIVQGTGWRLRSVLVAVLVAALSPCVRSSADEIHPVLEHDVLPLLKARCLKCHSPLKSKGKLNLSSPRSLARGGSSGPVIVPGNPDESTLWDLVSNDEMPPKPEEPLSADEKSLLRRWIEQGARDLPSCRGGSRALHPATDHWAFAPAARPQPPSSSDHRPRPHPGRSLHPEGARRSRADPRSRRRSRHLDPPRQLRPDGPAASARGGRCFRRRSRS